MCQIYNGNIKRPKPQNISAKDFTENSAEGLGSTREHCWSYVVSAFENKTKNLVLKVGVKATC